MPAATSVSVSVNGEPHQIPDGLTVPDLLRHVGLDPERSGIAVALGGAVVRRADWPATPVEDGADIEIITATQGG